MVENELKMSRMSLFLLLLLIINICAGFVYYKLTTTISISTKSPAYC